MSDDLAALAAEAYIYGFPLVVAPAAPFRPLMRLYQPRADILNGSYQIPPITKAAS